MKFIISRDTGQAKSVVKTLNLRKVNFQLLKELVNGTSCKTALRDKRAEESWQTFKDIFLITQELAIYLCKKSGKEGRRPTWMSKDLLVKLKHKIEMHKQWKQGYTSWKEYVGTSWVCRHEIMKAKEQI